MPNTFDTFQTPNRKSLGTNQQDKIQWLFWNEMGWGEGGTGDKVYFCSKSPHKNF